ncbi:MAG: CheR family methyltransferase, partial [Thalassolituus sp.]
LEYRRRAARLPDLSVLATDLSPTALSEAKSGAYPWIAIRRGLSGPYQEQYFTKTSEDVWTVKPEVRKGIEFREFNLNDSYTRLGQFDVVFCRNVLIYFSSERKRDILIRIHGALKEGGYLFLGASEALTNLSDYYEMISCRPGIIYRKKAFAADR